MTGLVHIVGAGLSGLSAAARLAQAGARVVLWEAAPRPGGRCRSYVDAGLGRTIDNGNHLVLSGNAATLGYLRLIGAQDRLAGPEHAEFPFVDLETGRRWTVRPNDGRLPWWVLSQARRVPGTRPRDYLRLRPLLKAPAGLRVKDVVPCSGPLWRRLIEPLLLAALNTDPAEGSARLAGEIIRETLGKGGLAYRPRIADPDLDAAFISPALAFLDRHGGALRTGRRLVRLGFDEDKAAVLDFADEQVALGPGDQVVLAVPAPVAARLVPGLDAPDAFRAIVNGHFIRSPPAGAPRMLGVLGGTAEWIFTFPDRISVTVSAADRLVEVEREELARLFWTEIGAALGLDGGLPPWQIVKEKRATFAATPEQDARRPPARTAWSNLVLAGDWLDTGLPATIEGSIRSGQRAAQIIGGREP